MAAAVDLADPLRAPWDTLSRDFVSAWKAYLTIRKSPKQLARDVLAGRDFFGYARDMQKNYKSGKFMSGALRGIVFGASGEFFATGTRLMKMIKGEKLHGVEMNASRNACVNALTVFVRFLALDDLKRATGFDSSVRDIYNKNYLAFKQQWTRVLRSMVTFVRLEYKDDGRWRQYLRTKTTGVDWENVVAKVTAAEAEVLADDVAALYENAVARTPVPVSKTAGGKRLVSRTLTSKLNDAELLAMRGLLVML